MAFAYACGTQCACTSMDTGREDALCAPAPGIFKSASISAPTPVPSFMKCRRSIPDEFTFVYRWVIVLLRSVVQLSFRNRERAEANVECDFPPPRTSNGSAEQKRAGGRRMSDPLTPFDRAKSFCAKYRLKVPILLAPMAGACPASLSIAVANAGGMGA